MPDWSDPQNSMSIFDTDTDESLFFRDRRESNNTQVLRERALTLARPAEFANIEAHQVGRQLIQFRAGESYYGIELSSLREILKASYIASIPCTPRFILGLIQVHGEITVAIDLVDFFGFRRTGQLPSPTTILVVEVNGSRLGIAVDELEDVRPLDNAQIKPTPAILSAVEQETTLGVVADGTVILDAEALTSHSRLRVSKRTRST